MDIYEQDPNPAVVKLLRGVFLDTREDVVLWDKLQHEHQHIIKRLVDRYDASSWTNIKVGELQNLAAETMAWKAATISGLESGDAPLLINYDMIIVDEKPEELAKSIENCLPLLSKNGVLVSTEPMVPTGDVDETDELKMALVNGFNDWIELIKKSQIEYYVAFITVFEGTIVTFLKK